MLISLKARQPPRAPRRPWRLRPAARRPACAGSTTTPAVPDAARPARGCEPAPVRREGEGPFLGRGYGNEWGPWRCCNIITLHAAINALLPALTLPPPERHRGHGNGAVARTAAPLWSRPLALPRFRGANEMT